VFIYKKKNRKCFYRTIYRSNKALLEKEQHKMGVQRRQSKTNADISSSICIFVSLDFPFLRRYAIIMTRRDVNADKLKRPKTKQIRHDRATSVESNHEGFLETTRLRFATVRNNAARSFCSLLLPLHLRFRLEKCARATFGGSEKRNTSLRPLS